MDVQILMPNGKPYTPNTTQLKAHKDPKKYIGFFGGYGCVSGDTIIRINRAGNSRKYEIADAFKRTISTWKKRKEVVSNTRSLVDGIIRLNAIEAVLYSGIKHTFEMILENGKKLRATKDHEIMTKKGFVRLGDLTIADEVMCDSPIPIRRGCQPKKNDKYVFTKYHPFRQNCGGKNRPRPRVEIHRAIYEAHMNGMSFSEFVTIIKNDPIRCKKLRFINTKTHCTHHIDGNHYNNSIDNLECITKEEHKKIHADYTNFSQGVPVFSKVKSIKYYGLEDTYDIACVANHNFCANDIVIHNSGKSSWGVISGIMLSARFPKNEGAVIRESIPALKLTTLKFFQELMPKQMIEDYNKQEMTMTLVNKSKIYFTSSDNASKFDSTQLGWYLLDEANGVEEGCFTTLSNRLRNPYVDPRYYRGMAVSNPTSRNHWLYKTFMSDPTIFGFHTNSSYENMANLPPGYIEDMKKRMSPEAVKRFIEGSFSFDPVGIPVFSPDFVPSIHIGSFQYNADRPLIRGWDFGFHRPACVFMQYDDDNRIMVLGELLGKDTALPNFFEQVMAKTRRMFPGCDEFEDYCDPAGNQASDKGEGETSVQILRQLLGSTIYPRFRKTNIVEGLEAIRNRLRMSIAGKPMLMFDHKADILCEAFAGGYHMDEKTGDKPEKDGFYDHLVDALRYAIINMGTNRKSDIIELQDYEYVPRNSITGY